MVSVAPQPGEAEERNSSIKTKLNIEGMFVSGGGESVTPY